VRGININIRIARSLDIDITNQSISVENKRSSALNELYKNNITALETINK